MGAAISGESEEQITCNYNEKQHNECKKTLEDNEQLVNNIETRIKECETKQEWLKRDNASLKQDLENSDRENRDYKKLNTELSKDYTDTRNEYLDMESKYYTAKADYNKLEDKYKIIEANYNKLNDRINRLKKACPDNLLACDARRINGILQEKFTPKNTSCSGTIIYCIIALVLGILIGSWLFGNYNRSTPMETIEDKTVNRVPTNEVEYKSESPVNE